MAFDTKFIALLMCLYLQWSKGRGESEPVCLSRFDYDSKVLQKLVDLKQKHKELKQRLDTEMDGCAAVQCPNGWMRFESSCYLFVSHLKMSWFQGKKFCDAIPGGHLAVMGTLPEQDFLTQQAGNMAKPDSHPFYWIGATDYQRRGHWVWYPNGSQVSDSRSAWHPGQPDNSHSQNCGCLWGDTDFTFHDHNCNYAGYIVCEKENTL